VTTIPRKRHQDPKYHDSGDVHYYSDHYYHYDAAGTSNASSSNSVGQILRPSDHMLIPACIDFKDLMGTFETISSARATP
jgi:hypothetical protein